MKIVFFDFVIHYGGGSGLAADTICRLSKLKGVDIEVIDVYGVCEPYHKKLKEASIKVHVLVPGEKDIWVGYQHRKLMRLWRMLSQLGTFWNIRRRLIKKVKEINPDIIWSNSPKGMLFLGTNLALRKYPLAREYIGCPPAASILKYDRWLMRHRADVIMAISTETSNQLQIARVSANKIKIVFDTIDMAETLRRSQKGLEAPLPGIDKYPRLCMAATILRTKGQDTAIKAVGYLKQQGLDVALWLAGGVIGNDQTYMNYLKNLVKELGISECVHFLGWRHDVPAIMRQADIVVHPSHEEGFGHVILEGMLLKRPVVATPVGGIKDSIQAGVNGLLFEVGDFKTLAEHIKKLAEDKEYALRLAQNGYKTATEKFNPEIHTKRVTQALIEAVNRKRKDK